MTSFRGRAGWLAASVLLVQVLALGASAAMAAVCCRLAVTSAKTMACCREKGHSCPLMKKQAAPADADGAAMKSCPGTDERIASLVFGGRGVLAAGVVSQVVPHVAAVAETLDRSAVSRPAPVDTPPPRA